MYEDRYVSFPAMEQPVIVPGRILPSSGYVCWGKQFVSG
jgi:hypothetical protein